MKKLFIKTYGCQMNVYDSARMADLLAGIGYAPTDAAEDADMVILNTCHIREKAAEKIYSELGRLKQLKDSKARRRSADADRGRGLRGAGRRRGNHRAPSGGRSSSSARNPIIACRR